MGCTTGVRIAPTGARWTWNTLADSACSHHIPSLAPAVALPAPRHDRRRTGAAGSPPGGFPFVELTSRGCEMPVRLCICAAVLRAADRKRGPRTPFIPAKAGIHDFVSRRAKRDPGPRDLICGPGSPLSRGRAEAGLQGPLPSFPGQWELALLQDATLAGLSQAAFRAHSSVGRAADS